MHGVLTALRAPSLERGRAFRLGARDAVIAFLLCSLVGSGLASDAAADSVRAEARRDTIVARVAGAAADTTGRDTIRTSADRAAVADTLVTPAASPGPRPGERVILLPEVRVERARVISEAQRRMPTAFVTDLEAHRPGRAVETLSELLGEAAGVRVVQYGGLGAFSTISLRGAPAGQVSIYLDGAPLTSAAHGVVNLADLPATAVDHVEVYRGVAPLEFGLATPGGAINLVTEDLPGVQRISIARGTYRTWEGRGTLGAKWRRVSGTLHAGHQGSDGDFTYDDDNGTPFNLNDDEVSPRVNNRFDAATALATVSYRPMDGLELMAREDAFHKAQGVPGMGATPALHPRLAFDRSLTHFGVVRDATRAWPEARAQAEVDRERSRFRDTGAELGLGPHDTDDRFEGEHYMMGLRWPRLPLRVSLGGSGSLRLERAELHDPGDPFADPPPSDRRTVGGSLELQLRPIGEATVLHAAKRWDRIEDALRSNATAGIPQASDVARELDSSQLGARVTLGLGLDARANWSDAARVPDFLELFGNQGSVIGNAALTPERSDSWDAGLSWTRTVRGVQAGAEWAHYETHARDLILYTQAGPGRARAENVARARIRGEELSVRLAPPGGVTFTGAMTWQGTIDQGRVKVWNGRWLPQRPERQASARVDVVHRWLRLVGDVQYIGPNFLDRANRMRESSRTLVGASVSVAPVNGLRLTVEGKNLGDERATDVGGFPLPGRSLFVSCQVQRGPRP